MTQNIFMFNAVMAMAIALMIVIISIIKNPIIKAVIYSIPIPITLALVASQNGVNSSHIVGLFLLVMFLWLVHWMRKISINIFIADIIAVVLYVGIGYLLVRLVQSGNILFAPLSFLYAGIWISFIIFGRRKIENAPDKKEKVHIAIKGVLIFLIAIVLLTIKDVLKGIVVTFPFLGVFVVVEMQDQLYTLASEFAKNSIAILAFFVIVYAGMQVLSIYPAIIFGWVGYLLALTAVIKFNPQS